MRELFNVGMLASANVGASAVQSFLSGMEPALHFLIGLGQLGVAIVTILYIVKKLRTKKQLDKE
jgi:uncharacterized membrane protein YczE